MLPIARRSRGSGRAVLGLALLLAGCGKTPIPSGSSKDLLDPSQVLDPAPVVRISAAGVQPQVSHISSGVAVQFVNNDTVAHRMTAAPELNYGDCPEMATLPTLGPGASGTVTITRSVVICAFHDAAAPSNMAFQGLLVAH